MDAVQEKEEIMAQYLIVKFDECGDQWECDGNRTPIFMTDNWQRDYPDYEFEVYELEADNTLKYVGGTSESSSTVLLQPKREGMALTVWRNDDIPEKVILDFPSLTPFGHDFVIPSEVNDFFDSLGADELEGSMLYDGAVSYPDGDKVYVFGYYRNKNYYVTW